MIVITMITRHTTTITDPIAIPTSLAQLQEHMAVSAVPALSESDSKEGKKLYTCKQQQSIKRVSK